MATPRYAWGIDVGNRALKAVKVVRGGNGLRIDDVAIVEHEHILSNAGDNRDSLVQASLSNFAQTHAVKGAAVAIGVSGQQSFARFIKLPPVEKNKIPEIVRFEAIQQIPFPLDEVEWSYQLFHDEASPDVEVGIFAMRRELVNRHIEFFTDTGLDVHVVQMNPLAVYNAMQYDQRLKGTSMIIDIGAENTDLIIAENESVWLRSIPIGGNQFTEALTKSFKLRFDKAEDLKRNAATSKYARQILQAMRPVFADLVSEIQRSIGFYASVHRDSRISRVLALGGTFRLPGLQKYLQQNLQLEVHRVDRLGGGAPDNAQTAALFNENLLSSVAAYGLALQALGEGKIVSSLLPMKIRRERMWREKTKWFGAAAAISVLAAGAAFGSHYFYQMEYGQTAAQEPTIDAEKRQFTALDSQWSEIEQKGGPERKAIEDHRTVENYRTLWPQILQVMHGALPDPGPEVRSGKPERIKKVPRPQRKQVKIEQLASRYEPDLTQTLALPDSEFIQLASGLTGESAAGGGGAGRTPRPGGGVPGMGMPFGRGMYPGMGMPGMGMPGMGMPSTPPPGEGGDATETTETPRGFLIALRCLTPNANPQDIARQIRQEILATNPDPKAANQPAYRIERVAHVSTSSLAAPDANGQPGGGGRRLFGAGGGQGRAIPAFAPGVGGGGDFRRPGAEAAPNPGAEEQVDTFIDPVTGESLENDFQFTMLVAITLDPKPKTDAADGAAEGATNPDGTPATPAADGTGTTTGDGTTPAPADAPADATGAPPAAPAAADPLGGAVPGAVPADGTAPGTPGTPAAPATPPDPPAGTGAGAGTDAAAPVADPAGAGATPAQPSAQQ